MALRRNIRKKRQYNVFWQKLLKWLFIPTGILSVVIFGFILYFNGQHVKVPLIKLLSERSGIPFQASSVEFSPIYPDTVKIHDIRFASSHIGELYLEYDLKSLLSKKELLIKELYLRDAFLSPLDLDLLRKKNLGFDKISITSLRAKHVPVELPFLSAKDASFDLSEVNIGPDLNLNIKSGSGSLVNGLCDGISYQALSGSFSYDDKGIYISNLKANALGGFISGSLTFQNNHSKLDFDNLQLDRVVLKDPLHLISKYSLSAKTAELNDVTAIMPANDLSLSGINGRVIDMQYDQGSLNGNFKGDISEITKSAMQLTLEENKAEMDFENNSIETKLSGNVFDGSYELDASFSTVDTGDTIRMLKLESPHIELTRDLVEGFLKDTEGRRIALGSVTFENARFLSHVDWLPISATSISGNISGFSWSHTDGITPAPAGMATFTTTDLIYSDLRINSISCIANLTDPVFMLSVPKLQIKNSLAGMTLSLSRNGGRSFFMAQAHDFDLSVLNSSLIPHLLSGKINLDADLKSKGTEEELLTNLTGSIKFSSNNLLISSFGLDLINGGKKEDFVLDKSRLLTALADSDCGMHQVKAQALFNNKQLRYSASASLSTADVNLNGQASLPNLNNQGKAFFVSTPKDSITVTDISGTLKDPIFSIKALQRGMMRPGLFVKALSKEEEEAYKEKQQAEETAQQRDHEKLLNAVQVLKDQIAILEQDTKENVNKENQEIHQDNKEKNTEKNRHLPPLSEK